MGKQSSHSGIPYNISIYVPMYRMGTSQSLPQEIFRGEGEARSTKGGLVMGSPRRGSGSGSTRTPEKFSKFLEKLMKFYNFLHNLKENLPFFIIF